MTKLQHFDKEIFSLYNSRTSMRSIINQRMNYNCKRIFDRIIRKINSDENAKKQYSRELQVVLKRLMVKMYSEPISLRFWDQHLFYTLSNHFILLKFLLEKYKYTYKLN